jgi:hypothetical protein
MAFAEVLRITHSVQDEVKVVDGKLGRGKQSRNGCERGGGYSRNGGQSAIQVQAVIQVTVTVREAYSPGHRYLCIISDSREAQIATQEAKSIIQQTAN